MADINYDFNCCGIAELSGITGFAPESILKDAVERWFEDDTPRGFLIFSTAGTTKSGQNLAAYIRAHHLGHCREMPPTKNPNSGHDLRLWCWRVANKRLYAYAQKKGWIRPEWAEDALD